MQRIPTKCDGIVPGNTQKTQEDSEVVLPIPNLPDVLYSADGARFFLCKFCCKAFSNLPTLDCHTKACTLARQQKQKERAEQLKKTLSLKTKKQSRIPQHTADGNKKDQLKDVDMKKETFMPRRPKTKVKTTLSSDGCEISIISIDTVNDNINSLSKSTRSLVVDSIKEILKNSSITIVSPSDSETVVIQTAATDTQPALQITSRNVDETSVELKTRPILTATDQKPFKTKLPDIAEILENNFGPKISKAPSASGNNSVDESHLRRLNPRSLTQDSLFDDNEVTDLTIDEVTCEGAIVLEDLFIHICKRCGSVYSTLEDLLNHDKYEHRHVRKRYPESELEKFELLYHQSGAQKCPICNKFMPRPLAWKRHLRTHADSYKFPCRICKKNFTRKDHRSAHERRHVLYEDAVF